RSRSYLLTRSRGTRRRSSYLLCKAPSRVLRVDFRNVRLNCAQARVALRALSVVTAAYLPNTQFLLAPLKFSREFSMKLSMVARPQILVSLAAALLFGSAQPLAAVAETKPASESKSSAKVDLNTA